MRELAGQAIRGIMERDRVPVIVGGSISTIREITMRFRRDENPELRESLEQSDEEDLRKFCAAWGLSHIFEYRIPLEDVRDKVYTALTADMPDPLPNVYPIGIRHDTHDLTKRIMDRIDQMWDQGLPEEVERLVDTYGWVGPLNRAIGYKEFKPGPDGQKPNPDEVRRAILANTIGLTASQQKQLDNMGPIHWAESPEHAVEIGLRVINQWRTNCQ